MNNAVIGGKIEAADEEASGNDLRIVCFKMGKADAFLISVGGRHMLIDTGFSKGAKDFAARLRELGADKIYLMILTHYDKDHVGGAPLILSKFSVERVIMSCFMDQHSDYRRLCKALERAKITPELPEERLKIVLNGAEITVDPPKSRNYIKNYRNNISLITRIRYGENSFLFMADADSERIQEYLSSNPERCDFLKVPYHGRRISSFGRLLKELKPRVAVITSSDTEPEDRHILRRLRDSDVQVFLTRRGEIICFCDGKNMEVIQEKIK